jgi:CHAT domain-containing protein
VINHKIYSNWIELKQPELEKLVDDFAGRCADRFSPLPELQELGGKLFSLLVQPVMDKLDEKQLVVFEADQRLWRLPLQALWTLDHRYFGEQFYLQYSPGILTEKTLRRAGGMHPQNALLQVESIPGFGPDLAGIANRFIHPTVISGVTATAPQVLDAAMKSDILFFFGHSEPKGRGAMLRLSDSTSMDSQDFTPAVLSHLSTAVLAACSTGTTGQYGVLDTHSLVHAFLAGKVPSVVASQWDVETSSTVHLMNNIFQNSLDGDSLGKAVTNAQREYLVSHPQGTERHPYYWAGFTAIGRIN